MAAFKCKICGGTLKIEESSSVAVCEYCGVKQTLPRLDNDKKINLYDRANHFRMNNDFDKALSIYEEILNIDPTDAESYWSIILCRYGIEYVEDPSSGKRIPTVNRTQFTSIFDDEDYKSAIKYADGAQRAIYEEEAEAINEIQKGILSISMNEEPFDVFICYKETDSDGRRTHDSVLATELYHELTEEGFKVFFSRITLEDKLGTAYEPYIFAALNSSKVMVVLGTKPEFFNAVWVKNEWSRYLSLIKKGEKKMLIPAYRGMDPYDLPEEFSHLQAQDMSKLGFMQDLTRGIKKIVEAEKEPEHAKNQHAGGNSDTANTAALIKRAAMSLSYGEFKGADEFCEQVLNQDPENAQAYLIKLLAENRVRRRAELANCRAPFDNSFNYACLMRFASPTLKNELASYLNAIKSRQQTKTLHEEVLSVDDETDSNDIIVVENREKLKKYKIEVLCLPALLFFVLIFSLLVPAIAAVFAIAFIALFAYLAISFNHIRYARAKQFFYDGNYCAAAYIFDALEDLTEIKFPDAHIWKVKCLKKMGITGQFQLGEYRKQQHVREKVIISAIIGGAIIFVGILAAILL